MNFYKLINKEKKSQQFSENSNQKIVKKFKNDKIILLCK